VAVAPADAKAGRILTVPNLITLVRLCCIPVFLWLLFGEDDRAAAATLLAVLGATDWVDGWIARRFDQGSALGQKLDPIADRLLFIVAVTAMIVDGSVPVWFAVAVVVREVAVGLATVVLTARGMRGVRVTWWGKWGTALLMVAFPLFLFGASDIGVADACQVAAWLFGIPGLVISYYAAYRYIFIFRAALAEGGEASAS
jgi:cardiolipin synthase (CMP-forming)